MQQHVQDHDDISMYGYRGIKKDEGDCTQSVTNFENYSMIDESPMDDPVNKRLPEAKEPSLNETKASSKNKTN